MAANPSLEPVLGIRTGLDAQPSWKRIYRRFGSHIGFSLAAALLVLGWAGRETRELSADAGLGYLLGIVSVTCMALLLLYPLRKRIRLLKVLGPVRNWFRFHMILGMTVALAALYHCNFTLGSFNSRVALFSALLVAGSGLIGRYIYAKIHHGLYGRKANLKELLAQINLTAPDGGHLATFVPELTQRLTAFDKRVMVPPKNVLDGIKLLLRMTVVTRLEHWRLVRFIRRRLMVEASVSPRVAQHRIPLERATRLFISRHLRQVRKVAEFNAYERLFSLWHVVHLPFFVLLIISAAVHIWAVHAY